MPTTREALAAHGWHGWTREAVSAEVVKCEAEGQLVTAAAMRMLLRVPSLLTEAEALAQCERQAARAAEPVKPGRGLLPWEAVEYRGGELVEVCDEDEYQRMAAVGGGR